MTSWTPCDTGCTCVQQYSSWGCSRCCSYGNPEQQQAQAEALTKRDAEIAEYAAHEEQTHRILGGILGTDDSLERCAKRMRERAEAAEARLEAMRAVVEAAREVADSPAEFDDERIDYVVLQVNRIDLSGLRQALGALDI